MHDSDCRFLIAKNAKIFWSYVKHVWVFLCEKNYRILIVLYKEVFIEHQGYKLVPASFSEFLERLWEENKSWLKKFIVITLIIFLHYKETN